MNELTQMDNDYDVIVAQDKQNAELKRLVRDLTAQREKLLDAIDQATTNIIGWDDYTAMLSSAVYYCSLTVDDREYFADIEEHEQALREQQDEMRHP